MPSLFLTRDRPRVGWSFATERGCTTTKEAGRAGLAGSSCEMDNANAEVLGCPSDRRMNPLSDCAKTLAGAKHPGT